MTGYKTRKKRLRGIEMGGVSFHPSASQAGDRKVYDVWTQPTVKDVYAQLKVAETMLCRIPDIELTPVRRKMFELEDLMWQFLGG